MEYPTNIYLQFNVQTYELQKTPTIPGAETEADYILYTSILTLQCNKGIFASEPAAFNFKITEGGMEIDNYFFEQISEIFNGEYPGSNNIYVQFHTDNALYKIQKISTTQLINYAPFFGLPLAQWADDTIKIKVGNQTYTASIPSTQQLEALMAIMRTGEITFTKDV